MTTYVGGCLERQLNYEPVLYNASIYNKNINLLNYIFLVSGINLLWGLVLYMSKTLASILGCFWRIEIRDINLDNTVRL